MPYETFGGCPLRIIISVCLNEVSRRGEMIPGIFLFVYLMIKGDWAGKTLWVHCVGEELISVFPVLCFLGSGSQLSPARLCPPFHATSKLGTPVHSRELGRREPGMNDISEFIFFYSFTMIVPGIY